MHSAHCLNCNKAINNDEKFCAGCGQKVATHRLSLHEIFHDAFHAMVHADKGFFYLIKELALRPGTVAREYVEGKRKKYFNPFSFLVIVTGIVVLASSNLNTFGNSAGTRPSVDIQKVPPAQRANVAGIQRRAANLAIFFNKHSNVVLFVSTPFFAFILWLLYRKQGLNYAEHLSAVVFFNSFIMMFTALLFAPLIYFTRHYNIYFILLTLMMLSHLLYITWGYKGFLKLEGVGGFLKSLLFAFIATAGWVVFSRYAGIAYVRWGP